MKKEKKRLVRIIIDTLRLEELLTHITPNVNETILEEKKKELDKLSYEQLLQIEELCKNNKKYFYEEAFKREEEKQMYINRIIEIYKLDDLNDQVISEEDVYKKFRDTLEDYSLDKVKSLLEVYRRRKTTLYDQVMNCHEVKSLKIC